MSSYNIKTTNAYFLEVEKQMNNGIEQNEEAKEMQQTGNIWQDKILPFLKALWADKIKCLYILALFLQVLFLLLQFLPIMNILTEAEFSLFGGLKIKTETLSMFELAKMMDKELSANVFMFLYIVCLAINFFAFFKRTVPYFVRKKDKIGKGFLGAQVSLIVHMLFFLLFASLASGMANEVLSELSGYYESSEVSLFSLTVLGNLYWIVALSLFIVQWVLSIKIKEKKEEDKINARVVEELQKKSEEGNV